MRESISIAKYTRSEAPAMEICGRSIPMMDVLPFKVDKSITLSSKKTPVALSDASGYIAYTPCAVFCILKKEVYDAQDANEIGKRALRVFFRFCNLYRQFVQMHRDWGIRYQQFILSTEDSISDLEAQNLIPVRAKKLRPHRLEPLVRYILAVRWRGKIEFDHLDAVPGALQGESISEKIYAILDYSRGYMDKDIALSWTNSSDGAFAHVGCPEVLGELYEAKMRSGVTAIEFMGTFTKVKESAEVTKLSMLIDNGNKLVYSPEVYSE